jgi:ABC-2 type transport system permease protein
MRLVLTHTLPNSLFKENFMTTSQPALRAPGPLARLGWTLADAWTVAGRDLAHWLRQPGPVILGWFFPVLIVLMFAGLFGGAFRLPAGSNYIELLLPGMFAMSMLFGLEATMIAVTTDAARGVTDRFRSLPISGAAVVLGRCIADLLNSLVGLLVLLVTGLVLGWRWHNGIDAALAALGLLVLLRIALLWIGIFFGLTAKGPEAVVAVQILVWPIGFLSSVYVDPATMPWWLGTLAQWNPLSATATATRSLFGNPGFADSSWAAQHAALLALVWPLVLTAIFLPLTVRAFRNLNAK